MIFTDRLRVGYVLKRYPRYSETFIVNEILAHEADGLEIEIFSLRPPNDPYFQDIIARVRSPVNYLYLPTESWMPEALASQALKGTILWATLQEANQILTDFGTILETARGEEVRDVYQAVQLALQVRRKNITNLHAHFGTMATRVARLAANFAKVPYSFTAHAKDIFHENVQFDDLRRKLTDAAAVVTVSDYNLEYLRQKYGSAAERVQRIYNGLDLKRFPYIAPDNRQMRIVSVGRLIEKKGFTDLIAACAILAGRGCEFSCQIIGTGPLEVNLKVQIDRLGLQGRVELMGARPQLEVIDRVQSAAVFAGPYVVAPDSDRDGLPMVLLEAMALGTPCVSTDVTGVPEILRDRQTGLMVPQHDPVALAGAMEKLLIDSSLRVQLATQARHLIETQFDIHRNSAALRDLFRSVRQQGIQQVQQLG
ncbi:MAG: glycosyltransferase [Prochloraceae cyanobacterium]|nr:glycosyltransferase [Prochloraceae cyanobacterium]